ncbi:hypothetical protein SUDANB174_07020 [Streptomyces sp. enrichment culture]
MPAPPLAPLTTTVSPALGPMAVAAAQAVLRAT